MPSRVPSQDCNSAQLCLKDATIDDLDDLARLAQAGFPDDPEWDYRFPHRAQYPEDNWKWTRKEYEGYLNQPEKFKVQLAVLTPGPGQVDSIPIALAVWDRSVTTASNAGEGGLSERRDANPQHMKVFADTLEHAFEQHFSGYAERQLHLWLLATHPAYRHRGAGSRLCRWGMEYAAESSVPVTVLASPMGRGLYTSLGFRVLGDVVIQVENEPEKLVICCLEWDQAKLSRSTTSMCVVI